MNVSSNSPCRPWSTSCFSSEAFGRLTLGTTRLVRDSKVLYVGRLWNSSYGRNARNADPILLTSIPILYKNQPPKHTAMVTDFNRRHPISKCASDPSSTWSAKNDGSSMSGFANQWDELSFPSRFGKKRKPAHAKKPNFRQGYSTGAGANYKPNLSKDFSKVEGFDICLPGSKRWPAVPNLDPGYCGHISMEHADHKLAASKRLLRPGMILLKNHLPHEEQVDIVKTCQTLGVGPGGFYQPASKDGAKLDLQLMCLGLNWDPERLTYEFIRSFDGCEVPAIPYHFRARVREAFFFPDNILRIEACSDTNDIFSKCIPNVCIVNFYSAATGRLGLHQDCSESKRSLEKRLPVVSFSVGDSAEFLYGDERDANKAEKVILESGDVLIFGGESRHIYHGVSCIIPDTAPKKLVKETRLRPGRLNLTFREA